MFCYTAMLMTATTQEAFAQEKEESHYVYTDYSTNVTYSVFLRISGYQVEIFTNSTSVNKWERAKVLYNSGGIIRYQIAYNNWQYKLTQDPNDQDAILVKNLVTGSKALRYYKKQ